MACLSQQAQAWYAFVLPCSSHGQQLLKSSTLYSHVADVQAYVYIYIYIYIVHTYIYIYIYICTHMHMRVCSGV